MSFWELFKNRDLAIQFHKTTTSKVTKLKRVSNIIFDIYVLLLFLPEGSGIMDFLFLVCSPIVLTYIVILNIYDIHVRWQQFKTRQLENRI